MHYCHQLQYFIHNNFYLLSINPISYALLLCCSITIMFVKSYQRQLQLIFTQAAYKSAGHLLKCHSSALLQHPLCFKIDIALKIYNQHVSTGFKFCEKGITPRFIAQEIAIFAHQNPHFTLQIDSFGAITVRPTPHYYKAMKDHMLLSKDASHYPITNSGNYTQHQQSKYYIWYRVSDLSFSTLRILNTLQLHSKTQIAFKERPKTEIVKILDLSRLNLSQIQTFFSAKLIDTDKHVIQVLLPTSVKELEVGGNLKRSCLFQAIKGQWRKRTQSVVSTGCIRHEYLQLLKDYHCLAQETDGFIVKTGQVFPKITLEQLKSSYPHSFRSQLAKVLRYCNKIEDLLPIDLKKARPQNPFPFQPIGPLFINRSPDQILLLLLECISNKKIVQSYELLKQMRDKGALGSEQQLGRMLLQKLQRLLFEQRNDS